ncbi:MAG: hypothetical protein JW919_01215 [Candidatus Omnitrophica bacterium]|nr:hypothetical protein [Candidatus Omnitrophota bacterium]
MRRGTRQALFTIVILALCVCGCGYTSRSLLPAEFKSIYVENFSNMISVAAETSDARMYRGYRPGMEIGITRAVIDRFLLDGNLKIARADDANLVLKGELMDFVQESLQYDANNNVEEYRIRLVVKLELKDAKTGKSLWRESNFAGESTYRATGALAKSENTGIEEAIEDLARRVVERTVEGW